MDGSSDFVLPTRPSARESEEDILEQQRLFLAGKSNDGRSAATVVRNGDQYDLKNVGGGSEPRVQTRPEPDSKKTLKVENTDIGLVLTSITERKPKQRDRTLPKPTQDLFALAQQHPSKISQPSRERKRTSLFARRFDAMAEARGIEVRPTSIPQPQPRQSHQDATKQVSAQVSKVNLDTGSIAIDGDVDTVPETVQQSNVARVKAMTNEEIRDAHDELRKLFSESTLDFLASRRSKANQVSTKVPASAVPVPAKDPKVDPQFNPKHLPSGDQLNSKWLNMDKYEYDKLEWTTDVEPPSEEAIESRPFRNKEARFDLDGVVLAPDADLPTHLGLHHHGDNPHQAGYTLGELVRLIRSAAQQQRTLALSTITKVLRRAWIGGYDDMEQNAYSGMPGEESPSDNVFGCLMGMGVALFIRSALDDDSPRVVIGALEAIAALLVYQGDEHLLDAREDLSYGRDLPPLSPLAADANSKELPSCNLETEDGDENVPETAEEAQIEDIEKCREDLVSGLLRTNLIVRLRYILKDMKLLREHESFAKTNFLGNMLSVLIRVARHSLVAAGSIADCPMLMDTIFELFIEPGLTSWTVVNDCSNTSLWSPSLCAAAVKLLRLMCQTSANVAARTLTKSRMNCICGFFAASHLTDSSTTLEVYRILATSLRYGLYGEVFVEFYDVLYRGLCRLTSAQNVPISVALLGVIDSALGWIAQRGSSTSLPLRWHHVEHLRDPLLNLISSKANVMQSTTIDFLDGSHLVLASAIKALVSYHAAIQKSPQANVVDNLDLAAKDCEMIRSLEIWSSHSQRSLLWSSAVPHHEVADLKSRMTPFRFRFHPSFQQGIRSSKSELHRLSLVNLLVARTTLVVHLVTLNKELASKCSDEIVDASIVDYVRCCGKLRLNFDRHDITPFHELLDMKLQMCLVRWSILSGAKYVQTQYFERMAARLLMMLPAGFEPEAKLLLGIVLRLDAGKAKDNCSVNMQGILSLYAGRLISGPISAEKVGTIESLLMPQRTKSAAVRLPMAEDWLLEPLEDLYRHADKSSLYHDNSTTRNVVELVLDCFVMVHERGLLSVLAPFENRLKYVLYVFGLGTATYSNAQISSMLDQLWTSCAEHLKPDSTSDVQLLRLYQNLIEEFVSMSYGDRVLAKYLLLPMRQKYAVDYRMDAFDNDRFLTLCTIKLNTVSSIFDDFLQPCESDGRMIQLYTVALLGRKVDRVQSPVLYWIAVHHICGFVFQDCGTEYTVDPATILDDSAIEAIKKHRQHIVTQIFLTASDELYRDVMFYKYCRPFVPTTPSDTVEDNRLKMIKSVASETASIRQVVMQRHPSLLE